MHADSDGSSAPTTDEVATLAYLYYLDDGCPEGRSEEHWLRAEACLRERKDGNGAAPARTARNRKEKKATTPKRPLATATKRTRAGNKRAV